MSSGGRLRLICVAIKSSHRATFERVLEIARVEGRPFAAVLRDILEDDLA